MHLTERLSQPVDGRFSLSQRNISGIERPEPPIPSAQRARLEKWLRERGGALPKPALIPRRGHRARIPLSFAQERIWFFTQYDRESPLYNLPMVLRLTGRLNFDALQKSLDAIVARHEALRTRFLPEDGSPVQVIDPPSPVAISVADLSSLGGPDPGAALQRSLDAECRRPFDVSRDLMLRAWLIRLNEDEHVLALVKHHIAADGWSETILLSELVRFYDGLDCGRPVSLAELPIQYADFALWQRERLDNGALEPQLAYWRKKLAGAPPLLEVPTDHPRPARQSFRGGTERRHLPLALLDSLRDLSRCEETTLFVTLLAAFNVLLHRACGQTDIVVGTPVAGRTSVDTEALIGFFVNTLALRTDLAGDPPFLRFLREVRETSLAALSHQELPFEKLVESLQPARTPSHLPIVQVMFIFQGSPAQTPQPTGLKVTQMAADTGRSKFDLTLYVNEVEGEWEAALEYNADLFEPATITRMLGYFQNLLKAIAADPTRKLSELPLLGAAQREMIVKDWNETDLPYAHDRSLADVFAQETRRNPQATAVIFGGRSLTYRELDLRAARVAEALRRQGVVAGTLVALCVERSLAMVVVLLGILKAGGAYLPLDSAFPKDRLAFMLEDSGAHILVSEPRLGACLPAHRGAILWVDGDGRATGVQEPREAGASPPEAPPIAVDLAYVLYTSGSTGRPKGVLVTRSNVLSFFAGMDQLLGTEPGTWLAVTSICFDISVLELLWTLSRGFRVVILSDEAKLLAREEGGVFSVLEQIRRHRVSHLQCTPSFARVLVNLPGAPGALSSIQTLLVGGEALPVDLAQSLGRMIGGRVLNMYGPTETTVWSSSHRVAASRGAGTDALAQDCANGVVPLGRPLANTRIHILDSHMEPVPVGMTGELYIGGDGVARGYLRRPELTEERFVADPFRPGGRLYRTGDLGRYRSDGVIDFLGRTDNQVKLRGHRIELGELEAVLRQHPAVRDCAAAVRQERPGDERLVAYLVLDPQGVAPDWRRYLERRLPPYLVPNSVVALPRLPLTPNGKVDRRALPEPGAGPSPEARTLPQGEVEARLVAIWESVLGTGRIGVSDNFFDKGGHSLLAVRLVAQVERAFNTKLPVAAVYEAPSPAQMAEMLEHGRSPGMPDKELVAIQPRGSKPALFLVHGIGGGMMWGYTSLSRHLGQDQPLYVIQSRGEDGSEEFSTIEEMAAHYVSALLRFQPSGPYLLGGYCFGGNVAFEMACQLRAQGREVRLLALINSFPPNSSFGKMVWSPVRTLRFFLNILVLAGGFLRGEMGNRTEFILWKLRRLLRPFVRRASRGRGQPTDPEQFADVRAFPKERLRLLTAHSRALERYRNRSYTGAVTLLRTRSFPLFCSFDPHYGWDEFAQGGVIARIIPGSHDNIMKEPNVSELARELEAVTELSGR